MLRRGAISSTQEQSISQNTSRVIKPTVAHQGRTTLKRTSDPRKFFVTHKTDSNSKTTPPVFSNPVKHQRGTSSKEILEVKKAFGKEEQGVDSRTTYPKSTKHKNSTSLKSTPQPSTFQGSVEDDYDTDNNSDSKTSTSGEFPRSRFKAIVREQLVKDVWGRIPGVSGKGKGGPSLLFTSVSGEEDNSHTPGFRIPRVDDFLARKKREIDETTKKRERLEDDESEDDDVREMADLLFKWLSGDLPTCEEEEHDKLLKEHISNTSIGSHCGLDVTYDNSSLDENYQTDVGLRVPKFSSRTDVPRSVYPEPQHLQRLFEGTNSHAEPAMVCLHSEDVIAQKSTPTRSSDTDSFIVVSYSLGIFRKGVDWCIVYDVTKNIKTGLHMSWNCPYTADDGTQSFKRRQICDIVHMYAGCLDNVKGSLFFIGFPHLYKDESMKNNYITQSDQQRFYDKALRPAFHGTISQEAYNDLPRTYQSAQNAAGAVVEKHGASVRKTLTHWPLTADSYETVWDKVMATVRDPTQHLGQFKDAFIFFDVKNIKTKTSKADLFENMECFDKDLDQWINEDHIENDEHFTLDLGSATTSPAPAPGIEDYSNPAVTYLLRDCCGQSLRNILQERFFSGKKGTFNSFTVAGLRDACAITCEPPKLCPAYSAGLRYVQEYPEVKRLTEASGIYPYQDDKLLQLAVDAVIFNVMNGTSKGIHARKRENIDNSWDYIKKRLRELFFAPELVSYGIRLEVRVTRKMWRGIKRRAKERYLERGNMPQPGAVPGSVWTIDTRRYVDYLCGNFDKYISLVEMCSTTSPKVGRSIERTRFMHVLIQGLQALLNADYARSPALWWGIRNFEKNPEETMYGLGFAFSLPTYGYCWFQPSLVDWELLQFTDRVGGNIAGLHNHLLPWYSNATELICRSTTLPKKYIEYIKQGNPGGSLQHEGLILLAHHCLRSYRIGVLRSMKKKIRTIYKEDIEEGNVPFSYAGFSKALTIGLNLVSGNRTSCAVPRTLFNWLFSTEVREGKFNFPRQYIEKLEYYVEFLRVRERIRKEIPDLEKAWVEILYSEFFHYHPLVPYPHMNGNLTSKRHKGKRKDLEDQQSFYAVMFQGTDYVWTGGRYSPNKEPPSIPQACFLNEHELKKHMSRRQKEDSQV
jgi:hypothetical protein